MNKDDTHDFKIEHGIPAPDLKAHRLQGLTEVLKKLPVGDYYIDLPADARANVHSIASRSGVKITTQLQKDGMLRVWRLE